MSKTRDGGPAFPSAEEWVTVGMSLRDWFAGQALMAFRIQFPSTLGPQDQAKKAAVMSAEYAYILADSMIAEREKGGSS